MSDLTTWQAWLDQHQQAQQVLSTATSAASAAKGELGNAEYRLTFKAREGRPDGLVIGDPATPEQVQKVIDHLAARLAGSGTHKNDQSRQDLQRVLSALQKARNDYAEAQTAYAKIGKQQAQAEKALADTVKARPEASPQALETVAKAMDAHQKRIDKITGTVATMKDSDSIVADLEAQARRASEEVERLEANALLGEVDERAKGQAATTLAKARKAAEKAAEQAEKQASARRGLEKMRTDLQAELAELERLRRGVGYEVGKAAMAKAESELVNAIEAAGLRDRVDAINAARDDANHYSPEGTAYNNAHIEVTLSSFYTMDGPERLEY